MSRPAAVRFAASLGAALAIAVAQEAAPARPVDPCPITRPAGFTAGAARPLVVLLAADLQAAPFAAALSERGFVVAAPGPAADAALLAALRRHIRIAHGGMHLLAVGDTTPGAVALATAAPWQLATLTIAAADPTPDLDGEALLAGIDRIAVDGGAAAPESVAARLAAWVAARERPGAEGEVHRALDAFHDAAARADAARYFALLPDDAVFLGTDGGERWTGAEFRAFAAPWFARDSAWIYVPRERAVAIGAGGAFAWFDERLEHAAYGSCRGTGVLERRAAGYVIRQYSLTIPVPNALAGGMVQRARDLLAGQPPALLTVLLVRHAERDPGYDPDLNERGRARSERLRDVLTNVDVTAVFATGFRRTQATVAPLCAARGLQPQITAASDVGGLAAALRRDHPRGTVVVAAHSDTIPALLHALGAAASAEAVQVADDDHDDLFVVAVTPDAARCVRLRY